MATDINLGEFNIANVDRIRFTVKKDGVAWSGIDTLTITFEKPDRSTTVGPVSCTVEDDTNGIWYYDTSITTFPSGSEGFWTLKVHSVDGSIVKDYPYEIGLHVVSQP